MGSDHTVTRRTALRTIGATAAVGTAGTAAASSFEPGDCARLTIDLQAYEDACPNETLGPHLDAGTEGRVWSVCTTSDGHDMLEFGYSNSRTDRAWASVEYFEHC